MILFLVPKRAAVLKILKFHHLPIYIIGLTFSAKVTLGSFGSTWAMLCIALNSTASQSAHTDATNMQPTFQVDITLWHKVSLQVCGHTLSTQFPQEGVYTMGGGWDNETVYEKAQPALPPLKGNAYEDRMNR